ncbi:unnamed protein product [Mytilus coruscus]|uniref:ShKT domain-containing protein n=1 Tax=Mytilus coruscus TaxID=42192 RepID=A0A6J8BUZ4_MYTCO|nr:unnamed protein product [Mytilus coruscus]
MFTDLYDITESKFKWRPVLQPGLFCKSEDLLCPGGICGITTSITSTTSSPTQPACQDSNLPICKNPKTISLVCRELDLRINCKKTCGLCRLRCYNCKNLNSVSKCFFKTRCSQDEVCDMIEGINSAAFGRRTAASITHCCNTDNCNNVPQTSQAPIHQPTLTSTDRPTSPAPLIYSTSRPLISPAPHYTTRYSTYTYWLTKHRPLTTTPVSDSYLLNVTTVKPCLDTGTQCTQKDFQRLVCGVQEFEPLCAKSCGLCK